MNNSTRYARIIEYYKNMIGSGMLKEGEKMPTEEEIGNLFNVSRITVRRALDGLAQNGYIYRIQGKGSYVTTEKTNMQLNHLIGFTQEMRMQGREPSTRVVSINIERPAENTMKALNLNDSQMVYKLVRIRSADGIPMAVEKVSMPFYLFPGLDQEKLEASLYEILSSKYGCKIQKAAQSIQAGIMTPADAELLGIMSGGPALFISRTTYDTSNTPFEYVESVYRGDKYKFNVTLYA